MPEGWEGREWKKMKKGGRDFSTVWEADSVQTWDKQGRRTACSRCCAKRKCIIINIKTRCFHSIRHSLKTFDKVKWTTGGLQFILAYGMKNKFKVGQKSGVKHEEGAKTKRLTLLNWAEAVLANDEWPAERIAVWSCLSEHKVQPHHHLHQQTFLLNYSFIPQGLVPLAGKKTEMLQWVAGATPGA